MTQQDYRHPIAPPPELVQQWDDEGTAMFRPEYQHHLTARAAQWGADQELEACVEWLEDVDCDDPQETANCLRAARRPKPPSLKEQAQSELDRLIALIPAQGALAMAEPIRRALEQLDD
jgi:hypothetical protein